MPATTTNHRAGADAAAIVKDAARGRWATILAAVCGIPSVVLDGKHRPCPLCGGTDRFRFSDRGGDGSIICNQCARHQCGDGLATVRWALGIGFSEALRLVADHLGIAIPAGPMNGNGRPATRGVNTAGTAGREPAGPAVDPEKDLEPIPWSDPAAGLIDLWCLRKKPIQPDAIRAAGGRLARYRGRYTVVDLPVLGEDLASVVGRVLYNVTGGHLPRFVRQQDGSIQTGQVKVKLTHGSRPGWIGTVDRLAAASVVWKVEGPTDCLALLSVEDLPPDVAVMTNAFGCGERPPAWMVQRLAGKTVYVVGDADRPGDEGAATWAAAIAAVAAEVRQVKLPYERTETRGKDLRDWIGGMET